MSMKKSASTDAIKRGAQVHQRYYGKQRELLPGVTSVIKRADEGGGLVPWANKLGLEGIVAEEYTRQAAAIGTSTHARINAHVHNEKFFANDLPATLEIFARNAFEGFLGFCRMYSPKFIASEVQFDGQTLDLDYGGTLDLVAEIDGVVTLIDHKTGNFVPKNVALQLEAYAHAWDLLHPEQPIERTMVLQLDKDTPAFTIIPKVGSCDGLGMPRNAIAMECFDLSLKLTNKLKELKW